MRVLFFNYGPKLKTLIPFISEFSLNNFRLDTLAFDKKSNSFVIIEYKRNRKWELVWNIFPGKI